MRTHFDTRYGNRSVNRLWIALVVVFSPTLNPAIGAEKKENDSRPISKQLDRLLSDVMKLEGADKAEIERRLAERINQFLTEAKVPPASIVPLAITHFSDCGLDERKGIIAFLIAGRIAEKAGKSDVLRAMVPHLRNLKEAAKPAMYEVLEWAASDELKTPYNRIEKIIKEFDAADRDALIDYMCSRRPDAAIAPLTRALIDDEAKKHVILATVGSVHKAQGKAREIAAANRLRHEEDPAGSRDRFREAREEFNALRNELKKLAEFEEWWVRYYVASCMKANPYLGDELLAKKLHEDKDPRVKAR